MTSNLNYKESIPVPQDPLVIKEEVDEVQFMQNYPSINPQPLAKDQIANFHYMPQYYAHGPPHQGVAPQIYVHQYNPYYNPSDIETVKLMGAGINSELSNSGSKKIKTDKNQKSENKLEKKQSDDNITNQEQQACGSLGKDIEADDSGKTELISQNGSKKLSKKQQKKLKKEQEHILQQQQLLFQQQQYYNPNQIIYQNQYINTITEEQQLQQQQSENNNSSSKGKKSKKSKKEQQQNYASLPIQPMINPHIHPQQQIQYIYAPMYASPYGMPQVIPQKLENGTKQEDQQILLYPGQMMYPPNAFGMIASQDSSKKKLGKNSNFANLKNPEGKETKNIPKNYARGIYKYIVEHIDQVIKITQMSKEQIMPMLDNLRDKIHSIKHLREYWINPQDDENKRIVNKAVRILSRRFLNDEAYPYFYHSSRMKNPVVALKFRRYLITVLQDPENFYYLKPKDKESDSFLD